MATRKWRSEQLVNTITTGNQSSSDVAALTGGGFVVVWTDENGVDSVIRGQRYDALGNRAGGEFLVITIPGFDNGTPTVTGTANGGFFVSWALEGGDGNSDIYGKVYNLNGAFVREQRPTDTFETAPEQTAPDVARLGAGSVAVWEEVVAGGTTDILARIFGADGFVINTFTANTATIDFQGSPSAAASPDGSKLAIAWINGFDTTIRARLFDAAGGEIAAEFQVDAPAPTANGVGDPVVQWLNNGQFAVAWRESNPGSAGDNQIRVRIFDGQSASPVALTGNILVNSTTLGSQQSPRITALPNGGFVVSWDDFSGAGADDSSAAVRLQAFDGSGGRIGGEIVVNTTTSGFQGEASIAALSDGRVVVTWTDDSGATSEIRSQIVDPRDGIVTGTGAADTLYGHDLVGDEISGFAGDDFLLALKGDDALHGGEGNDRLRGGLGGDYLDGGAGADSADYSDSTARVIVNLATGAAAEGFAAGDELVSIESVIGSAFNDLLTGGAAANTLSGQSGNDLLTGALGADVLIGGSGADRFDYNGAAESTVAAAGRDRIADFSQADDLIDLATVDADAVAGGNQPFAFIGTAAFTAAGQVRFEQSGSNTFVYANVDANLAPDLAIGFTGLIAFVAADFVL